MSLGRSLWNVARAEVRDVFRRAPREKPPEPEAQPADAPSAAKAEEEPPRPRRRAPGPAGDTEVRRWYANLELPYGAPSAEVRAAYRRLMRRYHPDMHHGNPEAEKAATELSQALRRAYEGLLLHLG